MRSALILGALGVMFGTSAAGVGAAWSISPLLGAAVAGGLGLRRVLPRSRPGSASVDEVAFLHGVAGELDAGATLPLALEASARHASDPTLRAATRAVAAGAPLEGLVSPLRQSLGSSGRAAGFAVRMAAETGASSAATFHRLADRAARRAEAHREAAALTSHTRLSAGVVAAAPAALLVLMVVTGRAGGLLAAGPVGRVALAVGVGLVALGVGTIVLMVRRFDP